VLVAGAGPVGLTAALALARRGVPVTVLEAGPAPAAESRASTFHPPSLEMPDGLGVLDGAPETALDAVVRARRDTAPAFVRSMTHANWERLRAADPAAYHDELRALAADPAESRRYLLRTSMIASLRDAA
jgi:2-polyprenyl-6-methoxyphenol hydroxylase-like FAD-dependent oxidoreductase